MVWGLAVLLSKASIVEAIEAQRLFYSLAERTVRHAKCHVLRITILNIKLSEAMQHAGTESKVTIKRRVDLG